MRDDASRASLASRPAAGIALGAVAGILVLLVHHEPLRLAPPRLGSGWLGAPGVAELVAVALAHLEQNASIASWLVPLHAVGTAVAVACFFLFAQRVSRSSVSAFAAALGLGLTAICARAAALPDGLALAAMSVALLGIASRRRGLMWTGFAVSALFTPSLVMAYVIVGLAADGASRAEGIRAAAVVLVAACITFAVPSAPPAAALLSSFSTTSLAPLAAGTAARLWTLLIAGSGPFAFALAAFGAVSLRGLVTRRSVAAAALLTALTSVFLLSPSIAVEAAAGPALLLFWALAAVGVSALRAECGTGAGARIAATVLTILLPILQYARPIPPPAAALVPHGQQALTLAAFRRLTAALPDAAVVVTEDETTDILFRSLGKSWEKSGKSLSLVARTSPELASLSASTATPVFALPGAQIDLQAQGYELDDAPPPQMAGVAMVDRRGACQPLTTSWQDVTAVMPSGAFSFVASDDASHGPVDVIVGSALPFVPRQLGWPPAAVSGFSATASDGTGGADAERRSKDLQDAGVPGDSRLFGLPHVLSLEIWRRPDAPRVLMVDIGRVPDGALARYDPTSTQRLSLCPAFPHELVDLAPR